MEDLWYKNAIIYGVDVDTFQDGNGDGIGDFEGLVQRLDYLAELGVTLIWLLPAYPTPDRDNGYDIQNYYGIDPRFGTLDTFLNFLHRAGEHGIRVLMDLVVNHTSDEHPWFVAARHDASSRFRDYYVWTDIPPAVPLEKGSIFPGQEKTVWTHDQVAGAYYYHRFYHFEPGLNLANPEVRGEICRIMDFWLSFGIAGFRVDAASHMVEPKGIPAAETDAPHQVLKELRRFVESRREGAVLLGEADVQPERIAEFFGEGDELNLLFNFLLNNYLFLGLARQEAEPIERALNLLPSIPHHGHWANFLRNLDEVDLERLTQEEREEVFAEFAPEPEMQIYGRGARRRLAPMLSGDRDRIRMAYSLLFSMPGSPVIVYGDEIGMGDDISLDSRNAVRTPMQWSAEESAGFSDASPERFPRPVITEGSFSASVLNVAAQREDPDSLLNWMKELIRVRRESPEIGWGSVKILATEEPAVFSHRFDWKAGSLVFVHNLSDHSHHLELHLQLRSPTAPSVVFGNARMNGTGNRGDAFSIELPRYGYLWIRAGGHLESIDLHIHR